MTFVRRARIHSIYVLAAIVAGACSPAAAAPSPAAVVNPSIVTVAPSQPATSPTPKPTPTPIPTSMAVLDGEPWIVYNWYRAGEDHKDLFLARPDGSDAHAIVTDIPGEHVSPTWSPDGARLAFVVRDPTTPNGSIWTSAADGSGATLLTDGEGQCPDGIFHPSWSPDGSRLAVICYPDPAGKEGSVATYDLATKAMKRLYTVHWPEHLDGSPSWSPDGSALAFSILHWDPTDQFIVGSLVATVPATGGEADRLTTFDTKMSYPSWSPDGTELVMHTNDLGNMHTTAEASNLYLIKPDGTGQRQLTSSSVGGLMRIAEPRWTPDGTRILVSVGIGRPDGKEATVVDVKVAFVDPAGGEPVFPETPIHGSRPDMRPTP